MPEVVIALTKGRISQADPPVTLISAAATAGLKPVHLHPLVNYTCILWDTADIGAAAHMVCTFSCCAAAFDPDCVDCCHQRMLRGSSQLGWWPICW
jgi:hypothetical protein